MKNIWKNLTEEKLLNEVEKITGIPFSNLCIKRNSYINRVFEIQKKDSEDRLIVKIYRPQRWTKEMILEEHDFLKALSEKDVSVIEPLKFKNSTLFEMDKMNFALFPKKGGRAIDEFNEDQWQEIGRLLGRIHLISENQGESKRLLWNPDTVTKNHLATILNAEVMEPEFEKSFAQAVNEFIAKSQKQFETSKKILIHGDCHRGNFIFRPNEGMFLVDFDDMCVGPPVQDLWMLLPDPNPKNCPKEIEWFLEGYETFHSFNQGSFQLISALKGMRMIHFAAWCAIQAHETSFQEHLPEWGTKPYWNLLIKDIHEITHQIF